MAKAKDHTPYSNELFCLLQGKGGGRLDGDQIGIGLYICNEEIIRQALISLVDRGLVQAKFDRGRTDETDFMRVPWGLATPSLRKRTRQRRKRIAYQLLKHVTTA